MSINQRLDLKQSQTLTMTPQLQQAIKLLQMSNLELNEFIESELEKNPLLERDDASSVEKADSIVAENMEEGRDSQSSENSKIDHAAENELTDAHGMMGGQEGYDAFSNNSFAGVGNGGSLKFDDSDSSLENTMAQETTLRDHLTEQIHVGFIDNKERAIAILLLDYLDESGYLRADIEELSVRLGCTTIRINDIVKKLQCLDPSGIFARDLSECLALQLMEKNRLDPAMQILLLNLDVLAARDFKKLKTLCSVGDDDLRDMIAEVKALNPKPALSFDHFVAQTVIPDVLMKPLPKSKGGGWSVELNMDTLPRVLLNKVYYTEIVRGARTKQEKKYLSEQVDTANWLIKALDQRAQTILKVGAEIILQQDAFFNYGVEFLKPLVLRNVAEAISMHESTVSRVTSGKYIGTPRGVFELKYFFTSGVSSTDGAAEFSCEAIKLKIKSLIGLEKSSSILSDDDLVEALKKDGVDIARRTVAKYREALKIPSSIQRRREKRT